MLEFKVVYNPTRKLIEQSIDLDKIVYDSEDDIVDIETCMSWKEKNDEIYTFLLCDKELVGYINFMPVTTKFYNKFKQGKTKDRKITINDITEFSATKPNKCILISIVINPKFQNGLALMRLSQAFKRKLMDFKQREILISGVLADCVSSMGEKCAIKYFNARHIANSTNGKIYEGEILI